jgi:hypothetical protein
MAGDVLELLLQSAPGSPPRLEILKMRDSSTPLGMTKEEIPA